MSIACITGISGQDGSYLAELLLSKNYEVHGIIRRSSSINTKRIDHIFDKLHLHFADMTDSSSLFSLIANVKPDEVYNLAAMSHVKVSFEVPDYTEDVIALGTIRLLEAIRQLKPDTKFYQASSSEMFGNAKHPQNELTPMHPNSPYAIAKLAAYHSTINYRQAYGIFACNGILFNHTSPRRGETFLTRKVTKGIAAIKLGLQDKLSLGNLSAYRDFGYSKEYVEAMWKIMQLKEPMDLVIGTGKTCQIEEFVKEAFAYVNLDWRDYIEVDNRYYRPTEVNILQADTKLAALTIDWNPKVDFKQLIKIMVDADLQELKGSK